ncbi:hypothetical protein ACFUCH_12295 [Streptomyces olivaceus]|uniref:hypothetical protein n=1 Tax=Streptomyces olivaceus TaxID=47716 RepID=UPI003624DB79
MTANDSEHAGGELDPATVFALWLQQLHREAGKPSYAQLVRRSRRRYPQATVREGTISEMLNGKRLPRWETVEPVAWALGGPAAVEACRQRWIEADAARALAAQAAVHRPEAGRAALPPGKDPDTGPTETTRDTPGASGTADVPGSSNIGGGPGRARRRWPAVVGITAVASVAAAVLVHFTVLSSEHSRRPDTTRTATATPAPSRASEQEAAGTSPTPSSSPTALTPGTALLTVHTSHPTSTRDGLVTISVLSVNGNNIPGAVYSVITPWTSCRVQGGDVGQSVVIKGGPLASWIRLVITDFPPSSHTDATRADFDIPINFQITRGQGDAPHATHACR